MKNQIQSPVPEWTILKLIEWTTSYFQSHGIDSPRTTAEVLLAHTLNTERITLYVQYDKPLSAAELSAFKTLIKRRVTREPVAYITGSKEFWSLDFNVNRDVLIPRPDTELLVETALSLLPVSEENRRILDLGTGSGAIVVALASERPKDIFFASDASFKAAVMAKQNAVQNKTIENIRFFCGDWLQPLNTNKADFDMILSNPPYIPSDEINSLQPEISKFEPLRALDGDRDGLSAIKKIITSAYFYIKPGGFLLLETGYDQKSRISDIVKKTNKYTDVDFLRDYAGHDRVVRMIKK